MEPSPLYKKLLELSTKHATPASLAEILAIRSPDAVHAWGHNHLVSRHPRLSERMDNAAFERHLRTTGPYLDAARPSVVHSVVVDEHRRASVVHMSYFLRPVGSGETVEHDLIWTLGFTSEEDVEGIRVQESVEFIDAAASGRLGEIIRGIHGEVGVEVRGGITVGGDQSMPSP